MDLNNITTKVRTLNFLQAYWHCKAFTTMHLEHSKNTFALHWSPDLNASLYTRIRAHKVGLSITANVENEVEPLYTVAPDRDSTNDEPWGHCTRFLRPVVRDSREWCKRWRTNVGQGGGAKAWECLVVRRSGSSCQQWGSTRPWKWPNRKPPHKWERRDSHWR